MDAATKRAIEALTRELQRTQADLATVKRAGRRPQLGFSSIESGSLDVVDPETGAVRLRLGYQPDGSVGVIPEGGDPPPAPTTPIVASAPVGLMVQWDGQLARGLALPADFDHVSVHVSEASGFTPTAVTFQGTIPRAGGLFPVVPLEVGTTYYVILVPVGTGGVEGAPSVEASGVPDPVGGVPGPGSITETELADDAVTTPKLRALAVEAYHIVAQAIESGHVRAQAIEAAHLAAEILLASRLIAGNPTASRVEIDENGLRGYDADNALVFAVQDGSATFSGTVTGSEISGSRISLTGTGGTAGVIEEAPGGLVRARMDSASGARAQLQSTPGQAEFSVWGDHANPNSPAGGVLAQPGMASLVLYSNVSDAGAPSVSMSAIPGEARAFWQSETGSAVQIRATPGAARIALTPPAATDPSDAQGPGNIFATRAESTDIAATSLQGPRWEADTGPEYRRRSVIFAEGARPERPYTVVSLHGQRVRVSGEAIDGVWDSVSDGALDLSSTHSILADRHAPVRTDMVNAPSSGASGAWHPFSSGNFPPVSFRTSWSGRTRFTITAAAGNTNLDTSTIHFGFGLTGGSTIGPAVARAWSARGVLMQCCSRVVCLDLAGNSDYVLTPHWNYSSGTLGGTVTFYTTFEHSIVVEPLT